MLGEALLGVAAARRREWGGGREVGAPASRAGRRGLKRRSGRRAAAAAEGRTQSCGARSARGPSCRASAAHSTCHATGVNPSAPAVNCHQTPSTHSAAAPAAAKTLPSAALWLGGSILCHTQAGRCVGDGGGSRGRGEDRGVGDVVRDLDVHQQRGRKMCLDGRRWAPVRVPPVWIPSAAAMRGAAEKHERGELELQAARGRGDLQFCRMNSGGTMYITSETSMRLFYVVVRLTRSASRSLHTEQAAFVSSSSRPGDDQCAAGMAAQWVAARASAHQPHQHDEPEVLVSVVGVPRPRALRRSRLLR